MLNYKQFSNFTHRTLNSIGLGGAEAQMATEMIVAHESKGGTYLRQMDGGPALGVIQMEKLTHDSIWANCDNIGKYALEMGITEEFDRLEYDLLYNIFMARMYLLMDTRPLPKTPEEMARYLKAYYNTPKGKAKASDYYMAWLNWKKQ